MGISVELDVIHLKNQSYFDAADTIQLTCGAAAAQYNEWPAPMTVERSTGHALERERKIT